MRIDAAIHKLIPIHPFGISRETRTSYDTVLIKIQIGDIAGYGEAFPSKRYEQPAAENYHLLESAEWQRLDPLFREFQPIPFYRVARDIFHNVDSLVSGVTAAYYDCFAQKFTVSVSELIGTSGLPIPDSSFTIGIDEPEMIAKKIIEAEPYPILKIKLGTDDDETIMRIVRQTTDKPIRVDVNEGWDPEEAVEKIKWLSAQKVELVEQPIPAGQFDAMRMIREKSPLPVIADEDCRHASDVPKLLDGFDGWNIKMDKCGGLVPALQMKQAAAIHGKKVMLGCMVQSSAGIAPAVAMAGGTDFIDLDGNILLSNDPFRGPRAENGSFREFTESRYIGMGVEERGTIQWEKLYAS